MKSSLGRNARFCAIHFGLSAFDIGQYKLNRTCFAGKFCIFFNDGFYGSSLFFAYEVIAIREGQLTLRNDFSREEADDIIPYLVT